MSRYNLIRIGDTYLTDDGTESGLVCRSLVTGLDDRVYMTWNGTTVYALDGTPYVQLRIDEERLGSELSIKVDYLSRDVFNELQGYIEEQIADGLSIPVTFKGYMREFSFNCMPRFPRPMEFPGTWLEGRVLDVSFNFTVLETVSVEVVT